MLSNSLNKLNSYIKKLNSKITTFWWLFFVLAASWTLQLINITRSSIWHDEGFTVMLIERFDFLEIIYRTGRDVHPPLHYLLLKPWAEFFGSSELALRSFSVVFMLAAIATAFFVLRRLFGEATARMSSVFLVLA
ncbi:MAG: glycosyltransferase family 39 protein, partial [Candidatus Saccharimonadales bacterium]